MKFPEKNPNNTDEKELAPSAGGLQCTSKNPYSRALHHIGAGIIVLGTLGSVIVAADTLGDGFLILVAGVLSSFVSGFLILGLSEIISILDDNRNLLKKMAQTSEKDKDEE